MNQRDFTYLCSGIAFGISITTLAWVVVFHSVILR